MHGRRDNWGSEGTCLPAIISRIEGSLFKLWSINPVSYISFVSISAGNALFWNSKNFISVLKSHVCTFCFQNALILIIHFLFGLKAAAKPKILERENSLGQKFKSIVFFYSFNYSFQKLVERAEQVYPYKSPWFYACQFTANCKRKSSFCFWRLFKCNYF